MNCLNQRLSFVSDNMLNSIIRHLSSRSIVYILGVHVTFVPFIVRAAVILSVMG